MTCLEKDPGRRFQSAAEADAALAQIDNRLATAAAASHSTSRGWSITRVNAKVEETQLHVLEETHSVAS
jgi:hypothetical protein